MAVMLPAAVRLPDVRTFPPVTLPAADTMPPATTSVPVIKFPPMTLPDATMLPVDDIMPKDKRLPPVTLPTDTTSSAATAPTSRLPKLLTVTCSLAMATSTAITKLPLALL